MTIELAYVGSCGTRILTADLNSLYFINLNSRYLIRSLEVFEVLGASVIAEDAVEIVLYIIREFVAAVIDNPTYVVEIVQAAVSRELCYCVQEDALDVVGILLAFSLYVTSYRYRFLRLRYPLLFHELEPLQHVFLLHC